MTSTVLLTGAGTGLGTTFVDALEHHFDVLTTEGDRIPDEATGAAMVHLPGRGDDPTTPAKRAIDIAAPVLVVVSSARAYGASPRHDMRLDENTPLAEAFGDADVSAAAAADLAALASTDGPDAPTRVVVLRPTHVVGPTVVSSLTTALRSRRVRTAFGFDPLMQLIGEADLGAAVVAAIEEDVSGAYNVCGDGALPLSVLARESKAERVGGLGGMATDLLERTGIHLTAHLSGDELRYGVNVSDDRFRSDTGWRPSSSLREVLASCGGDPA